jgi:hypothetical protein
MERVVGAGELATACVAAKIYGSGVRCTQARISGVPPWPQ